MIDRGIRQNRTVYLWQSDSLISVLTAAVRGAGALCRRPGRDSRIFTQHVPTGLPADEDQNYLICHRADTTGRFADVTRRNVAEKAVQIIRQNDDVYGTFAVMGFSLSGGSSSNYGLIFVPLKSVEIRTKKGQGHSASDILADLVTQALRCARRAGGSL